MRIISGTHRGRRLAAPPGRGTRPMLDRVREAVFSTLTGRVEDAFVLDLFAGTGSLGLEALSRGARAARLVERDPKVHRLLLNNIDELGFGDRAWAARGDALDPRRWGLEEDQRVDLAFLDPPYPLVADPRGKREVLDAVRELAARLTPDGCIVLHTQRRALDAHELPADVRPDRRDYGTSVIWYLEPEAAA